MARTDLIRFDCPVCGRHVRAPAASAGKWAECAGCRETIPVPAPWSADDDHAETLTLIGRDSNDSVEPMPRLRPAAPPPPPAPRGRKKLVVLAGFLIAAAAGTGVGVYAARQNKPVEPAPEVAAGPAPAPVVPTTPVNDPELPPVAPTPRPAPTPPVVQPTPPVVQPTPPVVQPTPPVVQPMPPVVQPTPPVVQPTPPVVQPTPMPPVVQPTPMPPVVRPMPPVVQPTPMPTPPVVAPPPTPVRPTPMPTPMPMPTPPVVAVNSRQDPLVADRKAPPGPDAGAADRDLKALQGKWFPRRVYGPSRTDISETRDGVITIDGRTYRQTTLDADGRYGEERATITRIDADRDAKVLHLAFANGRTARVVYHVSADDRLNDFELRLLRLPPGAAVPPRIRAPEAAGEQLDVCGRFAP